MDETVEVGSVVGTGFVVIVGLGGAAVVVGCPCVWIASQSCPGDVAEVDVVGLMLVITTEEIPAVVGAGRVLVKSLSVVSGAAQGSGFSTSFATEDVYTFYSSPYLYNSASFRIAQDINRYKTTRLSDNA